MRFLFPLGILLSLGGMAGLWHYAPAVPGTFAALSAVAGQPLPAVAAESAAQLPRLPPTALLYAIGAALICLALRKLGTARTLTPAGKLAIVLGGAATLAGAVVTFAVWWQVQAGFRTVALSEVAPRMDELAAAVVGWRRDLPRGFALAMVGQLAMLAACLPSFQSPCDPIRRPGRELALPACALLAIGGFAVSWLLACHSASAVFEALADPAPPQPALLAANLGTVIRYGLIGGLCLGMIGATQVLGALALPGKKSRVGATAVSAVRS